MLRDTKALLLQLLVMLYFIHKVYSVQHSSSAKPTNVTYISQIEGRPLNITFHFQKNNTWKTVSLYKNNAKIGSCTGTNKTCTNTYIFAKPYNEVTLHFPSLTKANESVYHVAKYIDNPQNMVMMISTAFNLTVLPEDHTTEAPPPPPTTTTTTSSIHSGFFNRNNLFIFATAVTTLVLMLAGILGCFYWTYRRKSGDTPNLNSRIQQQGNCTLPCSVASVSSSVEYGELDFQNPPVRPPRTRNTEASNAQTRVEYASIRFPPQKKRT